MGGILAVYGAQIVWSRGFGQNGSASQMNFSLSDGSQPLRQPLKIFSEETIWVESWQFTVHRLYGVWGLAGVGRPLSQPLRWFSASQNP